MKQIMFRMMLFDRSANRWIPEQIRERAAVLHLYEQNLRDNNSDFVVLALDRDILNRINIFRVG